MYHHTPDLFGIFDVELEDWYDSIIQTTDLFGTFDLLIQGIYLRFMGFCLWDQIWNLLDSFGFMGFMGCILGL